MESRIREWTRPRPSIFLGVAFDLARCKKDLVVENALLRQQLIVLRRQVTRPALKPGDRVRLVLLARRAARARRPAEQADDPKVSPPVSPAAEVGADLGHVRRESRAPDVGL